MPDKTVDSYIAAQSPAHARLLAELRDLVRAEAPQATEAIKWAQPVWSHRGPMVFARAFRSHVNFGFWRGAELDDPQGLLVGDGELMRHIKLTEAGGLDRVALAALVRQALALNEAKGDPTKKANR